jgi:hypothetical protein
LVVQRAVDLLETIARDHIDWVTPHKEIFIGPLAQGAKGKSVCRLAGKRRKLLPFVRKHLREFELSSSKALQARARQIRIRLERPNCLHRFRASIASFTNSIPGLLS